MRAVSCPIGRTPLTSIGARRFMWTRSCEATKPADLPVEQPKKFEFIINLKDVK